jgi:hypothetical protein
MCETMPFDARHHEMLYQHDIGITRFRKILRARAKTQLEKIRKRPANRKTLAALN